MARWEEGRKGESEREEERRKRNLARAERPEQTLSRAFSIMQIESDWLRSGFSTALLSFRASEFSPRYLRLLPSTLFSLSLFLSFSLSFSLLFVSLCFSRCALSCPCWTSGTNERRATAKASLPAFPLSRQFCRPSFLPGRCGIIEKFRWSFGFGGIYIYTCVYTYTYIYIAGLMHVARGGTRGRQSGKHENSRGVVAGNLVHRETALVVV